ARHCAQPIAVEGALQQGAVLAQDLPSEDEGGDGLTYDLTSYQARSAKPGQAASQLSRGGGDASGNCGRRQATVLLPPGTPELQRVVKAGRQHDQRREQ